MIAFRAALVALPLVLLSACGSGPAPRTADTEADYVVVLLKVGPKPEAAPGDLQTLMAGHERTLQLLFEDGELLFGGAVMPPRTDPEVRGIGIFDTADVAHVEELVGTDPAVQAGMLRVVAVPWRGPAALRDVPALERSARADLSPDAGPSATVRPYVFVTCADADRAASVLGGLEADGKVLFFGRFGGELTGHAMFALDARDPEVARTLLATAAGDAPEWTFHPCFAPRVLTELAAGTRE